MGNDADYLKDYFVNELPPGQIHEYLKNSEISDIGCRLDLILYTGYILNVEECKELFEYHTIVSKLSMISINQNTEVKNMIATYICSQEWGHETGEVVQNLIEFKMLNFDKINEFIERKFSYRLLIQTLRFVDPTHIEFLYYTRRKFLSPFTADIILYCITEHMEFIPGYFQIPAFYYLVDSCLEFVKIRAYSADFIYLHSQKYGDDFNLLPLKNLERCITKED